MLHLQSVVRREQHMKMVGYLRADSEDALERAADLGLLANARLKAGFFMDDPKVGPLARLTRRVQAMRAVWVFWEAAGQARKCEKDWLSAVQKTPSNVSLD